MTRYALTLLLLWAGSSQAATWRPLAGQDKLTFAAKYEGEAFQGRFAKFTPTVEFDAADAAKISIAATIELASVDTQMQERDDALKSLEFFGVSSFPQARFATTSCKGKAPSYSCEATLTLRDRTRKISFPFTWTQRADGGATLAAVVTLNRLDFDVGTGDWADTALIANEVKVTVELGLKPVP